MTLHQCRESGHRQSLSSTQWCRCRPQKFRTLYIRSPERQRIRLRRMSSTSRAVQALSKLRSSQYPSRFSSRRDQNTSPLWRCCSTKRLRFARPHKYRNRPSLRSISARKETSTCPQSQRSRRSHQNRNRARKAVRLGWISSKRSSTTAISSSSSCGRTSRTKSSRTGLPPTQRFFSCEWTKCAMNRAGE